MVWIQPSFSNWIRSLSGSHGLVLVRGRRDTEGEVIGHAEGKYGKIDRGEGEKKKRNTRKIVHGQREERKRKMRNRE